MTDRDLANRALDAQRSLMSLQADDPWWSAILDNLIRVSVPEREDLTPAIRLIAAGASIYALTAEMTDLVQTASEKLAAEWTTGNSEAEVLLPYDLPSPTGFVLFDHHINLRSVLGDNEHVESIIGYMWVAESPSSELTLTPADSPGVIIMPLAGRSYWEEIDRRNAHPRRFDMGKPPLVLPFDYAGWFFNRPWSIDPAVPLGSGGIEMEKDGRKWKAFNPGAGADRIVLYSFLRLTQQKIPHTERVHPGRQGLRRIEREHPGYTERSPEGGTVRILTLRRENPANEEEAAADVVWSHRWPVSPGWQRRRVATRDADGNIIGNVHGEEGTDWIYRRVYIAPYIKGPEHLPLVVKDTVRLLKR